MKDKTIILESKKTIKLSELTEEQKIIYDAGFNSGLGYAHTIALMLVIGAAIVFLLLTTFVK